MLKKNFYKNLRPKNFDEIKFHDHIINFLNNSIKFNNISSSYIFYGFYGVGKTSVARIFAKTLNCLNKIIKNNLFISCEKCQCCKLININKHPDFMEIDAASHRGIDQMRELREILQYEPVMLSYKILILDEFDCLTLEASKVLLKMLEEFSTKVIVLLLTTKINKIIPPLISRCQVILFNSISIQNINQYLNNLSIKLNFNSINNNTLDDLLKNISIKSKGSLRNALNDFEIIYKSFLSNSKTNDLYKLVNIIPSVFMNQALCYITNKTIKKLFILTDNLYINGFFLKTFWEQLIMLLNNKIISRPDNIKQNIFFSNIIIFTYDLFKKSKDINIEQNIFNNLIINYILSLI